MSAALHVAGDTLPTEVADQQVERDRGWRHRLCNRHALLLVPDARGPLPVWGCELALPIDVALVRDGTIVDVAPLEPCPAPCDACPTVGDGVVVDAVLEVPSGDPVLVPGDPVEGLPAR